MHFIDVYNERYNKTVTSISDNLYNYLLNNQWKGNIRELENIISRLVVFSKQNILEYSSILSETGEGFSDIDLNLSLKNNIEKLEKSLITEMLIKVKGNISKTSKTLEIDSKTLYSKMKKYDIDLRTIRKKIKQN